MKGICVCILNYNNSKRTVECADSVLRQHYDDFMLVITDNASTDNSVNVFEQHLKLKNISSALLKQGEDLTISQEQLPKAVILQSLKNGGFSYGNNLSIEFVRRNKKFDHMLLLNNDVILPDNFLSEIHRTYIELSASHPGHPVAISGTERGNDGKFHHYGIYHLNIPTGLVSSNPVFPSFRYISGACLFLPADAPFMDDGYFLYYDDVDYSKILLRNNYVLGYSEKAVFIHEVGATTRQNPLLYKIIFRSMKRFYMKHYPVAYPFVILFRFFLALLMGRPAIAFEILRSAFRDQRS